jgi:hypothetical protein
MPERRNRAVYDKQYRVFKELYQQTKKLMAELS